MEWQYTGYVYPMVFAAIVSGFLTAYGVVFLRRRGRDPVTLSFVALTATITVWTATTAVKVVLVDPGAKLVAYKVLYLGAAFAPPAFLVFALAYTERRRWLTRRVVGGLFVVPVLFVLVLVFNPADLGYTGWQVVSTGGVATLEVDDGFGSVVGLAYGFVVLFAALGLLGRHAVGVDRRFRRQGRLLALGTAAPVVVAALELSDVYPPGGVGVNLIPASLAVPVLTIGVAVFRFRLLDILPLAYAAAAEHSRDGIVVLDPSDVVVHANDVSRSLLAPPGKVVGRHATDVLPAYQTLVSAVAPVDVELPGDPTRYVELARHPLERGGEHVGWVVSVRDVTQRKRYELSLESRNDHLEVINRIVRHDIRNDMQLVTAYVDLVLADEEVSPTAESHLQTARRRATHTVDLTDVLGKLMRAVDESERLAVVDAGGALVETVDVVRESYPDATFLVGDVPTAPIRGNDLLESVFVNLLVNAVVHSESGTPTVDVRVVRDDDTVTIRVVDDGPGVPDEMKEAIFERGEKGFGSTGTGTGLYLAKTIVTNFGGSVRVEDVAPRGAAFVVELPLA